MKLTVKRFDELTAEELWEIYKLRVSVFVVEQGSPHQEVDDFDRLAYHLTLSDESGIKAYARVLPAGTAYSVPAFGRIMAVDRGKGLGMRIVQEAMKVAVEKFDAQAIEISAQSYVRSLYEKNGFVADGEEYMQNNRPHILMRWTRPEER